MNYEKKYLKYKKKYMMLQQGGAIAVGGILPTEGVVMNPKYENRPYDITTCNVNDGIIPCEIEIPKLVGTLPNGMNTSGWVLQSISQSPGVSGEVYFGKLYGDEPLRAIKFIKLNIGILRDENRKHKMGNDDEPDLSRYIHNEICLQNIAAYLNIAPKILDYWLCENTHTGVIVMEIAGNINLLRYMDQIRENLDDPVMEPAMKIQKLYNLYFACKLLIAKLMKLNHNHIIHNDLHLENIFVTLNDEGNVTDVNIIDYGLATGLKDKLQRLTSKIRENIEAGKIIKNIGLFNDFKEYALTDFTKIYSEIKRKITEFMVRYGESSGESFISNGNININSLLYYCALLVICTEIEKHSKEVYTGAFSDINEDGEEFTANDSRKEVNIFIRDMYRDDIGSFKNKLIEEFTKGINFMTADEVKAQLETFEWVDTDEFKLNIKDSLVRIRESPVKL